MKITIVALVIVACIQWLAIAKILIDAKGNKTKIKTEALQIGDFEIAIENGELSINPIK